MKTLCLLFSGFLFSITGYSQEVLSALKSGEATQVARYFDQTVEITIGDDNRSYNKKNAEKLLHNFFKENTVKNFEVIHKSESTTSQYYIGKLTTSGGIFRTTIYTKLKNNRTFIQELRFEK